MSVVRYFVSIVVKKDSIVCIVSEVKERSDPSQGFLFTSSEVKQCSEGTERFHFGSGETRTPE